MTSNNPQEEFFFSLKTNSNSLYRQIVENINEGIIVTDLEGRIRFSNQMMVMLTGYSLEEMQGQKGYELFTEKSEWTFVEKNLEERKRGLLAKYEVVHLRKDGTKWWAKIFAAPFRNEAGEIVGTIGLINDVTGIKEAEAKRELLLQQLDTAYRESKNLANNIVRELKDPLRAVSAVAEWVAEDYAHLLDQAGKEKLTLLKERASALNQYVQQLLEQSTLQATKTSPDSSPNP